MKILVVGPAASPLVSRLVYQLERNNHKVWVVSHNIEGGENRISLGDLRGFKSFFMFWKINKIIKKINPDLVHAHVASHYGLMCIFQRKPLVVGLWGSEILIDPNFGTFFRKKTLRLINWLVLKRADKCHTSSVNIADEAERQCKGSKSKIEIFFWGVPPRKPNEKEFMMAECRLRQEFGIAEGGLITFPRGLSPLYNPKLMAKIIKKISSTMNIEKNIVVLRAFSSDTDVENFEKLVDLKKITFVNRLLDENELYIIYSKTIAHVSVPSSDSLGSGVIEPAMRGSFPILSSLQPYREYIKKNNGFLITDFNEEEAEKVCNGIKDNCIRNSEDNIPKGYEVGEILTRIERLYTNTIVQK